MTGFLVTVGVVLVLAVAVGAWWLGRPPAGHAAAPPFPHTLRGYRPAQVEEVVRRLETRVAELDAQIAGRSGGVPAAAAAPATGEEPPPRGGSASPAADRRADLRADLRRGSLLGPLDGRPVPWRRLDLLAVTLYLLAATWVLGRLLAGVEGRYLSQGVQDQQAFEWYFGATAHNLVSLANPLFTDLQNFPDGVNLMANASVIGLGAPLAPLTLTAGPQYTFVLVELLGLTLTATGWYWLFRRRLPVHPAAAFAGGLLAGFAPGMVSHANGHPNFVAQFLVPVIVDRVLRLAEHGRTRRDGVVLGLLLAWQVFIGEEVLLLTAVGVAVGGVVLLAHRRVDLRRLLPGVGVGAAVCLAVVAVPLWWQFSGPQSYTSIWHPPAGNDLAQLWGRATRTVGADPWASAALSMNRTEENSFFGVPLWVAAAATVVALRRSVLVRALAVVVLVACWLSLGTEVTLYGRPTGIPGPGVLVDRLPVVENVLPTRFALIAVPALAALLVLGVEALRRTLARATGAPVAALAGASLAAFLALAPVLPTPLVADPRDPVPTFFSDGTWRQWVDEGGSVLAVPPTTVADTRALEWQAAARWGFPVVAGYFVGPGPEPDRVGQYGATPTLLTQWLAGIAEADAPRAADPGTAAQFEEDLRAGRVDALVLPEGRPAADALRTSLTGVFGEPARTGGVYVWDVRGVTDGG